MSDGTRARVLGLATRGELTIQQVDYLLGCVDEISAADADLLIRAFLAENTQGASESSTDRDRDPGPDPKRERKPESIGERVRGFTDRLRGMSAEDLKQTLNEEYLGIDRNPRYTADEKVRRVINVTAVACAGVTIQPIPLVDFLLFTPLQCIMASKISTIRGVRVAGQDATMESLKTAMGAVGLSILSQSAAASLLKAAAPGVGGLVSGPLMYGLTYGVGRVMDLYFADRAAGRTTTDA
ncbi:hypothetical protein HN937_20560, partial [Candidatus Poribacteria bacterium]|nr:hypothetical protein [Candidatus Poribacteria bacterium]